VILCVAVWTVNRLPKYLKLSRFAVVLVFVSVSVIATVLVIVIFSVFFIVVVVVFVGKVLTLCCTILQVMNNWGYVRAKECSSCQADNENSRYDRKECISCRDRQKGKIFEILRVRNRFVVDERGKDHSSGGYRDISFKIKVGFQVLFVCISSDS
jgi:hypothetical protein